MTSRMNISQAFANSTGASALIIRTSSSLFIIRFIRARGKSLWFLKSDDVTHGGVGGVITTQCAGVEVS